jgi:hypothetical protein
MDALMGRRRAAAPDFLRAASVAAVLAGVVGLLYSVSFVVVARAAPGVGGGLAAAFLLLGALLGSAALIGLYRAFAEAGGGLATWALALGLAGALAAATHGGYDLANAFHPPGGVTNAPSQTDPRGLGTFGLSGLALLAFSWLLSRRADWPRGLALLGLVSCALLVLTYLARLIVLDATSPLVLAPAAIEGFVVNPIWYVWLGLTLRGGSQQTPR